MKNKPIILVTGAAGQWELLQEEAKNHPHYQWHFYKRKDLDITKPDEVERVLEELRPAFCVNTAAYTNVKQAEFEKQEARLVNAAAAHLAKICAYYNATHHLSTDYVFDGRSPSLHRRRRPSRKSLRKNQSGRGGLGFSGEWKPLCGGEHGSMQYTRTKFLPFHFKQSNRRRKPGVVNDQVGTLHQRLNYALTYRQSTARRNLPLRRGNHTILVRLRKRHPQSASIGGAFGEIRTPSTEVKRPRFSALSTTKRF